MIIPPSLLNPRYLFRLVAVALILALLWHLSWTRGRIGRVQHGRPGSTDDTDESPPTPAIKDALLPCESVGNFDDIFLVLRTGASEAVKRLPAHFNSTLRCMPQQSYGIWSDYEEVLDGHKIQNALSEIDQDIVANNPDFVYYRRLQEKGRAAFSAEEIEKWATAPNSAGGRDTPGWKLDKWKFLPMAEQAYRQRPDVKWYIFMEGDTYINWSSMLLWLSRVDFSKRYYIGQLMIIGDVVFAYGGASFAISNPAMKALVEHRANNPGVYETFTSNHWAGDCVLGKALKDIQIDFTQAWPNFLGDSPFDVDYSGTVGGTDVRAWCYAAMTWHHLSSSDINELSELEQEWDSKHSDFMRHSDVFRHLVLPKLGPKLEDWDNGSSDDETSQNSFEECQNLCENSRECVQFSFDGQKCKTSKNVKLGHSRQPREGNEARATSGWLMDRVEYYISDLDSRCHNEDWVSFN